MPWLLRPPFLRTGRKSDFSGVREVNSAKALTDDLRRPALVGLYTRTGMNVYSTENKVAVRILLGADGAVCRTILPLDWR